MQIYLVNINLLGHLSIGSKKQSVYIIFPRKAKNLCEFIAQKSWGRHYMCSEIRKKLNNLWKIFKCNILSQ